MNIKRISLVLNSEDLPQDSQRIISEIESNNNLSKNLVFEFESEPCETSSNYCEDELSKYRQQLIETEQKIGDNFLKTILALSGGALGLSFAFIKNVIGDGPMVSSTVLIGSWSLLTISLAAVLLSLYLGTVSYRYAIKQVDQRKIYEQSPGGVTAKLMPILNFISTFSFVTGVILMFIFAFKNLGG